ncbi:MAG: hypothetical protein PHN31_00945 [Candidatus Gracilibacteria bacterium]|nr:hypothetical protein [Candidatus Gracilibacteria bacterium]
MTENPTEENLILGEDEQLVFIKKGAKITIGKDNITLPDKLELILDQKAIKKIYKIRNKKGPQEEILISGHTGWIRTKIENIIFEQ